MIQGVGAICGHVYPGQCVGIPDKIQAEIETEKAQENSADELETQNKDEKKTSLFKKAGVSAASYYCPGLGQVMNGDYAKGAAMYVANKILPDGLSKVISAYSAYDAYKNA